MDSNIKHEKYFIDIGIEILKNSMKSKKCDGSGNLLSDYTSQGKQSFITGCFVLISCNDLPEEFYRDMPKNLINYQFLEHENV